MLEFEPIPTASEPCFPTHCAREALEFLTKFMARQRFESGSTAWEMFVLAALPRPLFEKKNSWQKYADKKKKYDLSYWMNNFSRIFKMRRKIFTKIN